MEQRVSDVQPELSGIVVRIERASRSRTIASIIRVNEEN
jgi:hypothetical protein